MALRVGSRLGVARQLAIHLYVGLQLQAAALELAISMAQWPSLSTLSNQWRG